MFQSLRWRLIGAFSLTILLTMTLSGVLSAWMTASEFNVLVTSESYFLAEEIAPLLEANYAIERNWDYLDDILTDYPEESTPPPFFEDYWYSEIDWVEVVANELDLEAETLFEEWEQAQTLAAVAEKWGVDPEQLVNVIVEAEGESLQEVVESGELADEEATDISSWVTENARLFVYEDSVDTNVTQSPVWTEESVAWLLNSLLLDGERILVANVDGLVVYDSADQETGNLLADGMLEQGVELWDYQTDEHAGTVIVASGEEYYSEQQKAFLRGLVNALIVSGIAAGAIALLVGLGFARQITSPVTALTNATHHISDGHWSERLPVDSGDELGQMSAAFNAMAEALDTQRSLRNRLVDDVTHELNTPLSVIQLELEALSDGMQDPAEATENVKREIDLLKNLVSDLDLLTDFGEGKMQLDPRSLSYNALVRDAVNRWQAKAEAKRINLQLNLADDIEVNVDTRRITQVLGNLLANALEYTPENGLIEISTVRKGELLVTRVHNSGQGIDPADLPHLFERFYRADNARSRNTGGRGLGLAIVKEIVEMHGGRVWAESVSGEGSNFSFELPI
jgi:two-component system sensor histidine kinase BaeS